MARKVEVFITEREGEKVVKFIPVVEKSRKGGRLRVSDRDCLEGILWVLRSGVRWKDLPDCYPSPSNCWRRLGYWEEKGVFIGMWHASIEELDEQGQMNWDEISLDASFDSVIKGRRRGQNQMR